MRPNVGDRCFFIKPVRSNTRERVAILIHCFSLGSSTWNLFKAEDDELFLRPRHDMLPGDLDTFNGPGDLILVGRSRYLTFKPLAVENAVLGTIVYTVEVGSQTYHIIQVDPNWPVAIEADMVGSVIDDEPQPFGFWSPEDAARRERWIAV